MLALFITAIVLSLAAVVANTALVVQGFKQSAKRGLFTILAIGLLAGSLTCSFIISHRTAMAEIKAKDVQEKGQKEFEKQKNDLDNLENLEL